MVDALRAIIDSVPGWLPAPLINGCHPSFGIWILKFGILACS
jgi:hypothetical protein